MEKKFRPTLAQLAYFTKRVKYWQMALGVVDFDIGVEFLTKDDCNDYAHSYITHEAKSALICLGTKWEENITDYLLDKTAFHEVLEIMFDHLEVMAKMSINEMVVREAVHKIIITFENTVFEVMR